MKKITAKKKKTKIKHKRDYSLNSILWMTFSVVIAIFVAVVAIIQHFLLTQQYREQVRKDLLSAQAELCRVFSKPNINREEIEICIHEVSSRYNLVVHLLPIDGTASNEQYEAIYQEIEEELGDHKSVPPYITTDNRYASISSVRYEDDFYYLYLSSSLESISAVAGNILRLIFIVGLFALMLVFVASGFVSMLITKPVCEVTEQAKELAKGNYDVHFSEDYTFREVNELSKVLNYASSEISKADTMQKELIANVSHDFKTPLTMIKSYASMIQEISGNDPVKRKKHTQVIIDESDRLTTLIEDLLDLSKLQANFDIEERNVFNLSELLYAVVQRFNFYVETQGYTIDCEIADEIYTLCGRRRVEQVLYNLIGNAINYTGNDKIVRVRLEKRNGVARFEVIDSGKGIPKEEIDNIWERYYRATDSHKRPVRGTGLGLSIVKSILIRYGIHFGVLSEVGQGSCFWIDFPLEEEQPPQSE